MKKIYTFVLFCFFILGCKKEITQPAGNAYLQNVKAALKDSLINSDYAALDFSRALLNKVDSAGLYFLRVPFRDKAIARDFVMVKTTQDGKIKEGRIIHMEGKIQNLNWEGAVLVSSLNRSVLVNSPIHHGYITAFHSPAAREQVLQAPDLPEVVVVAYVHNYDFNDYSTWLLLNNLFYLTDVGGGGNSGGSNGDYYGSLDGGGGYSGVGGGSGSTGDNYGDPSYGVSIDPTIELEPEYVYSAPSVDISKMFKCFDYVPSAGASYSARLCADIPSNNNPMATTPGSSASSAGHTFLVVTKSNGATTVTQSFGFYPSSSPSVLDPFSPVGSTMKDNKQQEINASIEMNISESQFNTIKQYAIALSKHDYDLDNYNCTNYAMDVFNSARASPISIAPYKVILPGGPNPWGPSDPVTITIDKSPQMLFVTLQQMKTNSTEASKIVIDQTHNYHAPISKGECD